MKNRPEAVYILLMRGANPDLQDVRVRRCPSAERTAAPSLMLSWGVSAAPFDPLANMVEPSADQIPKVMCMCASG